MKPRWGALTLTCCTAIIAAGCGGPPADISGPWSGTAHLFVASGETLSGMEGFVVNQKDREVSFLFSGCTVKATAADETNFDIYGFDCQKTVNAKAWHLTGSGGNRITTSGTQLSFSLKGDADSGSESSSFTWTFSGQR